MECIWYFHNHIQCLIDLIIVKVNELINIKDIKNNKFCSVNLESAVCIFILFKPTFCRKDQSMATECQKIKIKILSWTTSFCFVFVSKILMHQPCTHDTFLTNKKVKKTKNKHKTFFLTSYILKKRTKNPKYVPHVFFSLLIPLVSIKIKLCVYKETISDDSKYQQRHQNCILHLLKLYRILVRGLANISLLATNWSVLIIDICNIEKKFTTLFWR